MRNGEQPMGALWKLVFVLLCLIVVVRVFVK
jgi:hypothetical protein